ncbi:MAG TPA: hypothetical protein PLW68_12055 [Casimicrobiaceae bacterium]|nr:hypothetical protein [Casimicrobiaceae bacterium]
MDDDEIEESRVRRKIAQVKLRNPQVAKFEIADHSLCALDGQCCMINADKLGGGQRRGHWHDIGAVAATDFQYAAILNRRGIDSVENGERRQAIRVRT